MLFMVDGHKVYIAICQLVDVIVWLRLMCSLLNSNDCILANVAASGSRQWRHRGVLVQGMLALPVLVVIDVVLCTSIGKKRNEASSREAAAQRCAHMPNTESAHSFVCTSSIAITSWSSCMHCMCVAGTALQKMYSFNTPA